MARFDRYMLSQLMVLFGFFALVLVSIYWINSAVRMFDKLIGDGQSAWVFIEFSALTLPGVIKLILPMASFAAAVFVTNRLSTESELTVVQATGYSPFRLARPVVVFGLIVAGIMSILAHVLVPSSGAQLALREDEIARNVTAKFLTEGEFLHPAAGITFYIREISPDGELRDVFLSDRRGPENSVTYTSETAYLVRDVGGTRLVMLDGIAQNMRGTDRLFVTHFEDFSYDVSSLVPADPANLFRVTHASTADLLTRPAEVARIANVGEGSAVEELHGRFNQALMCLVAALVGFSALLVGGFSRFGVWWQIVLSFGLLVVLKLSEGIAAAPVRASPEMWPFVYLPSLIGLFVAYGLLYVAAHPGLVRALTPFLRRKAENNADDGGGGAGPTSLAGAT